MKLNDITKLFIKEHKYQVKTKTYIHYQNLYERYINKYFDIELNLVEANALILTFNEIMTNYSYSLTKTIYSLVYRALDFAYDKGYLDNQIVFRIKLKNKAQKQVDCLSKKEQKILEDDILLNKKTYYYGFLISLYTGLRLGEVLSLKWQDINFEDRTLSVNSTTSISTRNHKLIDVEDLPKTNTSIREIPLTNRLIYLLKQLKPRKTYVMSNRYGEKINYRGYQRSFQRMLKRLKIKHYGFHSLRHTFATRLLENSVDIKTISELMGHSTPTITLNSYVHTNLENKRKAIQKITKKDDF